MALLLICLTQSSAVLPNEPNPLNYFPGDYYKLTGSPYLEAALEKDVVYQDENTSLFLSLKNAGNISSIRVNEEPSPNAPEEVYAAKMELDLEMARTSAQDISVVLSLPYPPNESPLEIRRGVAYTGNLRSGQVSPVLAFPVEVYRNAAPGDYTVYAAVNYTYQKDVAVKPESSRPSNPDIYYYYVSSSQVIPLQLRVARRSGVQLQVRGVTPSALNAGSSDNIIRIVIENIGNDTAKDLVGRLLPESGIYVGVDESPIPALAPGESAELVYKVDVSKDAVPGKRYLFKLNNRFSDSFREDLSETKNAYLMIVGQSTSPLLLAGLLAVIAAAALIVLRKRKRL